MRMQGSRAWQGMHVHACMRTYVERGADEPDGRVVRDRVEVVLHSAQHVGRQCCRAQAQVEAEGGGGGGRAGKEKETEPRRDKYEMI